MRLLLAFPPFHPPTSPPLGVATLKAALLERRPEVQVELADWNLAFFRRWLRGQPQHLCAVHPDRSLGQICPTVLLADGRGEAIWQRLCTLPASDGADDYIRAAQQFDGIYRTLISYHRGLLMPFVEQREELDDAVVDALFGEALATVATSGPDVLGLSILAEQNLLWALAFARVAKARYGVTIALGGAMMSHLDGGELLTAFPWLDVIFQGEAETSLVAFVDSWTEGQADSRENIPGIVHRGTHRLPCSHPAAAPVHLPDLPPPDFDGLPLDAYLAPELVLPIATSRGCYWGKCSFCSHTLPYAPGVRTRAAEEVADEMAALAGRYGARGFLLVDEAISPKTLRQLSEALLARDLDLIWGAEGIRVEPNFDPDLLRNARRAGLSWLYVGVESSCQRLLDLMDKGIDAAQIDAFVAACDAAGITPQLSFIVGIPGTTEAELAQEVQFMLRHPVDGSPFALLLGSPMQTDPSRFGLHIADRQRLFTTPTGVLHAPRFHFTAESGLSPQAADAWVEAETAQGRPRLRPHLGEIHAVLLAGTGFFASDSRPEPAPEPAEAALQILSSQAKPAPWTAAHTAGCLEALGELEAVYEVVNEALGAGREPEETAALYLHMVAVFNRAGRPDLALELARQIDLIGAAGPAAHAELMRSAAMMQEGALAIRHGEAMLAAGYEFPGAWQLLAELRETAGDLPGALTALAEAERRQWQDASINDAMERCLLGMKKHRKARRQREKATAKRAFFDR